MDTNGYFVGGGPEYTFHTPFLGNVYYDPKHPAGFGSVAKLVKASKCKKRDVEE